MDNMINLILTLIVYVVILIIFCIILPEDFKRMYSLNKKYGYKVFLRIHTIYQINTIHIDTTYLSQLIIEALSSYWKDFNVKIIKIKNLYIVIILNMRPTILGNNVYYIKLSNSSLEIKMGYPHHIIYFALIPLGLAILINRIIPILLISICLLIPFIVDTNCISFLIKQRLEGVVKDARTD